MDTVPIQQLGRRLLRLPPDRQLEVWMAAHRIDQSELARRLKVSQSMVSRVARGGRRSAPLVAKVRALTGVDLAS